MHVFCAISTAAYSCGSGFHCGQVDSDRKRIAVAAGAASNFSAADHGFLL